MHFASALAAMSRKENPVIIDNMNIRFWEMYPYILMVRDSPHGLYCNSFGIFYFVNSSMNNWSKASHLGFFVLY